MWRYLIISNAYTINAKPMPIFMRWASACITGTLSLYPSTLRLLCDQSCQKMTILTFSDFFQVCQASIIDAIHSIKGGFVILTGRNGGVELVYTIETPHPCHRGFASSRAGFYSTEGVVIGNRQ